MAHKNHNV